MPSKYSSLKVPEGHLPRGTTLREPLRGNLPLRGLCGGLSEGSAGSLRGFLRGSAGFCGGPRDFPRVFGGTDPVLVTLGKCWIFRQFFGSVRANLFIFENFNPGPCFSAVREEPANENFILD